MSFSESDFSGSNGFVPSHELSTVQTFLSFPSLTPQQNINVRILILSSELSTNVYELFPFLCRQSELFMKHCSRNAFVPTILQAISTAERFVGRSVHLKVQISSAIDESSRQWRSDRKSEQISTAKPIHILWLWMLIRRSGNITI